MTPCRDVLTVGWQEYVCRLSGASVEANCADGGDCIPHKALRYLAGALDINTLPPDERKAVKLMAERIQETEAAPQDVDGMTEAQLDALVGKAKERKRALRALRRQGPKLEKRLVLLHSRKQGLEAEIADIEKALAAIAEGRAAELPGPKKRRLSPETRRRMSEGQRRRRERLREAAKQEGEQTDD